jgi:hypothetical protein
MSRIEQIIGRAVRTKSHCGLPFKKRCVEIYLHVTHVANEPEYMDMYLYRTAEKKALRMGKVTRLMKEVSVDCLLNIEQSNFTVENLLKVVENRDIKLELSSVPGKLVPFQIGDKPHTAICDYMETCDYKCSPNADKMKTQTTDMNTYSIDNLKTNYQKIAKRIREIFREENTYFFKKRDLINLIQIQNEYEIEEIFYVLKQFIDKHEKIIDEYGAPRYLTQKGDVYIINHTEMSNNENAVSLYDITRPIHFTPHSFTVEDVVTPKSPRVKGDVSSPMSSDKSTKPTKVTRRLAELMGMLEESVQYVFTKNDNPEWIKGDRNWYKHLSVGVEFIRAFIPEVTDDNIRKYVVEHFLDALSHDDALLFVEATFNPDVNSPLYEMVKNSRLKRNIIDYMVSMKLKNRGDECVVMCSSEKSKSKWTFVSINEDTFLKELKGVDVEAFLRDVPHIPAPKNKFFILKAGRFVLRDIDDVFNVVTFISAGAFKKKNLENPRAINSNGANLNNVENGEIKKHIVEYLGIVNGANTAKKIHQYVGFDAFAKLSLCGVMEIVARYMTTNNVGGKLYYLKPIENVYSMGNSDFATNAKR